VDEITHFHGLPTLTDEISHFPIWAQRFMDEITPFTKEIRET
jgi:hypothetical protein